MSGIHGFTLLCGLGTVAVGFCAGAQSGSGGARRVAELLDRFAQPRFEKLDGRFGGSRMVRVNSHAAVMLVAENEAEKALLKEINDSGYSYRVDLLHVPHPKGIAPKGSPTVAFFRGADGRVGLIPIAMKGAAFHIDSNGIGKAVNPANMEKWRKRQEKLSKARQKQDEDILKRASAELVRLKQGKPVERPMGDWLLTMRPVKASKQACVNCHAGSKLGETLGVMVYAVREQKDPPGRVAVN